MAWDGINQYRYAHMCRDEHQQIGHNDSEHERCPLCREMDRAQELERRLSVWQCAFPAHRLSGDIIEHMTVEQVRELQKPAQQ